VEERSDIPQVSTGPNWKADILNAIDSHISSLEKIEERAAKEFNLSSPLDPAVQPLVIRSKCWEHLSGFGVDQVSAKEVVEQLLRNARLHTISPFLDLWTEYTRAIDNLSECHNKHLGPLLNATAHYVSPSESTVTSLDKCRDRRCQLQDQISLLLRSSTYESQPHELQPAWKQFSTVVSEAERILALDSLHRLRKQKSEILASRHAPYAEDPEANPPGASTIEVFAPFYHIQSR
jgi:hypothetical protein